MAMVPWDVPVLACVSHGCCPSGAPVSPWHTVSSPGYIFIPGRWGLSLTQLFRVCLCFSSQQSWIRVGALSGLFLSLPGWLHAVHGSPAFSHLLRCCSPHHFSLISLSASLKGPRFGKSILGTRIRKTGSPSRALLCGFQASPVFWVIL